MNGHLLSLLVAILIAVVVAVLAIWTYNRRIGRVLARLPSSAWGARCVDPANARAWRVLIIDGESVRLEKSNGTTARSWAWDRIAGADRADLRPGPSVVSHGGIELHLSDGQRVGLLLPSRSTFSYPPELVDEALAQVAAHRH